MAKKIIWFVINPIAGGKNKNHIPSTIHKYLNIQMYDAHILTSQSAEHTLQLAKKAVEEKVAILVAVGGDGTINNIAKFTKNSQTKLAIIPLGSGNGFARELKLYGSTQRAIQIINQGKSTQVDSGNINDEFFVNLCGIGFDAHVGSLFAGSVKRGLRSYLSIIWKELLNFKPERVHIQTDTTSVESTVFMVSICNGPQFGNNAFIAPNATLTDGLFDITIIEQFPAWKIPFIAGCMLLKKINWVKEIKQLKAHSIQLQRVKPGFVNIDGEPVWMQAELNIGMYAKSIAVLTP